MKSKAALVFALLSLGFLLYVHQTSRLPEKDVVAENSKEGAGSNIKLAPQVAKNLGHTYDATDKELPFCVFGEKKEKGYRVTDLDFPEIVTSQPNTTKFVSEECARRKDFLGIVHNHERGSCFPSKRDLFTFLSSDMDIFLVYCRNKGDRTFVGITRDIFDSKKVVDL